MQHVFLPVLNERDSELLEFLPLVNKKTLEMRHSFPYIAFLNDPSLKSTYLPIPKCQQIRGTNKENPRIKVVQSMGVQFAKSHFWSPSAQNVTPRWNTSPIRSGTSSEKTILSCRAGCSLRWVRAADKTNTLMRPRRAQTWPSCKIVTRVAVGSVLGGGMPCNQGACALCV